MTFVVLPMLEDCQEPVECQFDGFVNSKCECVCPEGVSGKYCESFVAKSKQTALCGFKLARVSLEEFSVSNSICEFASVQAQLVVQLFGRFLRLEAGKASGRYRLGDQLRQVPLGRFESQHGPSLRPAWQKLE